MNRRMSLSIAAAGLLALAGAPAASAATPFTVGQGVNPKLAVSPDGTGHLAWAIPARGAVGAKIGYCRIPAGASACDRAYELTYPDSDTSTAAQSADNVTVQALSDTDIVVAGSCYSCTGGGAAEAIYRWESTDAGATAPVLQPLLGTTVTTTGLGPDGINIGPGASAPYVSPASGQQILSRPGSAIDIQGVTGFLFVYSPSLVRVPGQNKLVYAVNDLDVVKTSVFSGTLTTPSIMTDGNWTKDIPLSAPEADNQETDLNAGPSGVWLTYQNSVPLNDHLGIRKFDAATNTWGAPRYLESPSVIDAGVDYPSSSQDASGRVHVVWRSLYDTKRLRYTVSDPTGATFAAPADLAQNEDFFLNPEVGAGADGKGWAVWQGNGDTPIRVVRIDPYVDPGETPPAPGPGTTPAPTPAPPAATRNVVATVPGASITFGVPSACVQPGSTFKVTLSWKRKKRKGNKFVKVTRADFSVAGKVVKVDRRAPFVQTLKVTASARRGSTIALRARAYIKVKRGKAPKKSIRATIKVC